jgi:hypothetical protein
VINRRRRASTIAWNKDTMKTVKRISLMVALFLCVSIGALLVCSGIAPAQTKSSYTKEECVQCHAARVNDIATAGGKHKIVPCIGCHHGHPPEVKKPIAQCSKCHLTTRKAHFEVTGCLNCHKNPHTPMKISFQGKNACLNCHQLQSDQLKENKSKHTALDCSTCHDVHRKVPLCTQCHVPHGGKVTSGCKNCHNAHMPKLVTYSAELPSKDCGMCHKQVFDLLSASTSKHKPFECARCHVGKHRMVPTCQSCHGSPHPASIMVKFPQCGKCHNTAHDLNNWSAELSKGITKEAPKETPKNKK